MNLLRALIINRKDLKELDYGMLLTAIAILLFGVFIPERKQQLCFQSVRWSA